MCGRSVRSTSRTVDGSAGCVPVPPGTPSGSAWRTGPWLATPLLAMSPPRKLALLPVATVSADGSLDCSSATINGGGAVGAGGGGATGSAAGGGRGGVSASGGGAGGGGTSMATSETSGAHDLGLRHAAQAHEQQRQQRVQGQRARERRGHHAGVGGARHGRPAEVVGVDDRDVAHAHW